MSPGCTPTPNANEPPVTWPSTLDTVRQLTMYTPSGRDAGMGTTSCRGCPWTARAFAEVTGCPFELRTWIHDRPTSGCSVNVTSTCRGAVATTDPFASTEQA